MEIKSLKELQQLIRMCKKHGVEAIKVDNIEFKLSPEPKEEIINYPEQSLFDPGPIAVQGMGPDQIPINPDGSPKIGSLTEEQMLMWSSAPGGIPESPNL